MFIEIAYGLLGLALVVLVIYLIILFSKIGMVVDDPDSRWIRHHHLPTSQKSPLLCRNKGVIYVY